MVHDETCMHGDLPLLSKTGSITSLNHETRTRDQGPLLSMSMWLEFSYVILSSDSLDKAEVSARTVADLEIHWRAKRTRKFLVCHAHFRSHECIHDTRNY